MASSSAEKGQGRRVLAGSAILFGILAVTGIVFFFDAIRTAWRDTYTVVAVFHNGAGLRKGTPIWLAGKKVGTVTRVAFGPFVHDTLPNIAVTLRVPTEHQALIRRDSEVRITTARAIGDPLIAISPGSLTQPMLQENDTLFAKPKTTMVDAFRAFALMRAAFDSLQRDKHVLLPLATARQQQLTRAMSGLAIAQVEFQTLTTNFAAGSAQILNDPRLREHFAHLATTTKQLAPAFQKAGARYTDPQLRAAFSRVQGRASALSAQLDSLTGVLTNGTLARFARDSAIMKALHQAQLELDSLMAETKRNPMRYILGPGGSGRVDPLKR